jgi:hypothetical protein
MACKLEPALPSMLGSLTVMGGAEAQGNETAAAEFNFFADVEAAAVVFTKYSSVSAANRAPRAAPSPLCAAAEPLPLHLCAAPDPELFLIHARTIFLSLSLSHALRAF